MLSKIKAVMIGHAVGDALGVPVEFASREELAESPVTDMEGFGTYPYPAGTWSDDTSLSLAALDSLATGKIRWNKIMNKGCVHRNCPLDNLNKLVIMDVCHNLFDNLALGI